jgi:hypothetical protein
MGTFSRAFIFLLLLCSPGLCRAGISATATAADYGKHNGAIILSISGGIAPYTCSWSGPGGFTDTAITLTDLAPGNYCVTVTDHYCGAATLCVTVTETPATGIKEPALSDIRVYPNPFNGSIHLSFAQPLKQAGIAELRDISGKLVQTASLQPQASGQYEWIIGTPLSAGSYILTARDAQGQLLLHRQLVCQPQ